MSDQPKKGAAETTATTSKDNATAKTTSGSTEIEDAVVLSAGADPSKTASDAKASDPMDASENLAGEQNAHHDNQTSQSKASPTPPTDDEAANDEPEPEKTRPPTVSAGIGRLAAAGVVGGLIGALAVSLVGPLTGLARKDEVAGRFSQVNAALRNQTDGLNAEIADLAAGVEANQADVLTVVTRLEAAESANVALADGVSALTNRMDAMNDDAALRERERAETMDNLRSQVAALAAAIAATPSPGVEGEAAASAPVATRLALLEGAVRRLDARVSGLSSEALPTADLSRLDILETRVRALEARPIGGAGDAALGVAFAGLAQALASAAPYETELETLEAVAEIEAPAALGDPAALGLPSRTALANRFERASIEVLEATAKARVDAAGQSWTEAVANRLSALVVVRRTDEVDGDSPDAILSRAQARLDDGDVQAALVEIDALPQSGQDAIADWLADARKRADAEIAFAELKADILGGETPDDQ